MFNQKVLSTRNVWWYLAIGVLLTVLFNFFVIFASYKSTQRSDDSKRQLEEKVAELTEELTASKNELAVANENTARLKSTNTALSAENNKLKIAAKQEPKVHVISNTKSNSNTNTNTNTGANVALVGAMDFNNPLARASHMHSHVQKLIYDSQHPKTCDKSKMIKCELNAPCGFACIFHFVIRCLAGAYSEGHTAVVVTGGWRYSSKGWSHYFQPLSSCDLSDTSGIRSWDYSYKNQATLHNIPEDILKEVEKFHDDPRIWYYSQFAYYAFRFSDQVEQLYQELKSDLGFIHPIAGIHVRRTDKVGQEARFHDVSEYMDRVDAFYTLHYTHLRDKYKRVFVATDEPKVLEDLKSKYPGYTIVHNTAASKTAGTATRYSEDSLFGILFDVRFLSESDILIGTFSSQVSRLGYEVMNARHVNAYSMGVTVMYDDHWYESELNDGNWFSKWMEKFTGLYLPDEKYDEINKKLCRLSGTVSCEKK